MKSRITGGDPVNKLSSKENRDRLTEMDRLEDNVNRMFTTKSKDEFDLAYEVAKISLDRIAEITKKKWEV